MGDVDEYTLPAGSGKATANTWGIGSQEYPEVMNAEQVIYCVQFNPGPAFDALYT